MYTRGQYSLITRTSMKALRLYDELGLLKPERVEKTNGYHYYSRMQVDEAARIQEWRRFGFSLQDMLELKALADTEGGREELMHRLRERQTILEAEVAEKRLIIGELAAKGAGLAEPSAGGAASAYDIRLAKAGGLYMLSCRQPMGIQDAGQLVGKLYESLFARSLAAAGGHLLIHHQGGYEPESADLEVGLPVQLAGSNPQGLTYFPERLCASTRHSGSFSALGLAHAAVLDWIKDNGYEPDGPPFEQYAAPSSSGFHPYSIVTGVFYPARAKAAGAF